MQKSKSIQNHARDPRWRPVRAFYRSDLPANAAQWLLNEGSLTEQLIAATGGDFRVRRIRQCWQQPLLSEQRLLGLPLRQWALVREVVLLCYDQPWVFARSVIPLTTLNGPLRHLRRLQNESLGSLIFRQPGLRRSQFELARLPAGSRYIDSSVRQADLRQASLRQAEPTWARRSLFFIDGKPLSVSEVFLRQADLGQASLRQAPLRQAPLRRFQP